MSGNKKGKHLQFYMDCTRDWAQEDLDKINKVLNTKYKLINAI